MKTPTRFSSCSALALLALGLVSPTFAQTNTYPFPASGNVGIGTTSPQAQLHITSANTVSTVLLDQTLDGGVKYSVSSRWGGYFTILDETNPAFSTYPRFAINPSGGVGIGTLFPLGALQVNVSSPWGAIANNNTIVLRNTNPTAWNATSIINYDSSNSYSPNAAIDFLNHNHGGVNGAASIRFYTKKDTSPALNEVMRITHLGNVGIGTNSPASRLHLADVGYLQFNPNDGSIEVGSGNDDFSYFDFKGNTHLGEDYWGRLGYSDSGGFSLTSKSSSATVLSTSTTGVNNYLVLKSGVAANSYGEISFEGVGSYAGNMYIGGAATGRIVLRSGGYTDRLVVDNSGNVGIGTSAPTHKLSVNGTVRAKEVIVETTGWADYVFAPGYALPTLAETEQHIAAHGHLPGIPSATEVAEQGVSVGELQVKLLRKLEEMTLHQIEMQKAMSTLQQTVTTLKAKISELEGQK